MRIFFIALAVAVVYLVRSTLQGALQKQNYTSIYLKILMNHLQLIFLTTSFNFNWLDQVISFVNTVKSAATVSDQILSFDCFLDPRTSKTTLIKDTRVFYQKLLIFELMTFILAAATVIFWMIYRVIKKGKAGKIISTLIIVLFLVHPNITIRCSSTSSAWTCECRPTWR